MEDEPTEKSAIKMDAASSPPNYTEAEGQGSAPQNADPEAPSYTKEPNDAPPAYDSIYGRLKHMKDNSSGNVDYVQKVVKLTCCNTVVLIIWIAVLLALPVAMIVIGSLKLRDCPVERYIPIYLIVWGVFGVIKSISNIVSMVRNRGQTTDEDGQQKKIPVNPFDGLISVFLFAWFIAGSYWIYHVHKTYQSTNPLEVATYCDNTLYLFAFWVQTVCYIMIAIGIFTCCAGCACACCLGLISRDK